LFCFSCLRAFSSAVILNAAGDVGPEAGAVVDIVLFNSTITCPRVDLEAPALPCGVGVR
jgi:hypothetical protein